MRNRVVTGPDKASSKMACQPSEVLLSPVTTQAVHRSGKTLEKPIECLIMLYIEYSLLGQMNPSWRLYTFDNVHHMDTHWNLTKAKEVATEHQIRRSRLFRNNQRCEPRRTTALEYPQTDGQS